MPRYKKVKNVQRAAAKRSYSSANRMIGKVNHTIAGSEDRKEAVAKLQGLVQAKVIEAAKLQDFVNTKLAQDMKYINTATSGLKGTIDKNGF